MVTIEKLKKDEREAIYGYTEYLRENHSKICREKELVIKNIIMDERRHLHILVKYFS